MKRFLFAAAAFGLVGLSLATAEDPKPAQPAQPKAVQVRPVQPVQPLPGRLVTPATVSMYEENVELLEVQIGAKKAYIKAAEVAVRGAEIGADRLRDLVARGAGSKFELDRAMLEVDAAKAQLEIRIAEMKEVEVRLKYARKRLEEAKAGPVARPVIRPGVEAKPADPAPPPAAPPADPKTVAELKAKIAAAEADVAAAQAAAAKAEAEAKLAQVELARILDIAQRGRVVAGTIEKAQAKVKDAKAAQDKAAAAVKAAEAVVADLKAKLKEIEK